MHVKQKSPGKIRQEGLWMPMVLILLIAQLTKYFCFSFFFSDTDCESFCQQDRSRMGSEHEEGYHEHAYSAAGKWRLLHQERGKILRMVGEGEREGGRGRGGGGEGEGEGEGVVNSRGIMKLENEDFLGSVIWKRD